MPYTPQAWDHANNNLFFKLGTIRLGVIGTLCKHRTTPITTQMCSHEQITFLGYGALHSGMDRTKYNGVV